MHMYITFCSVFTSGLPSSISEEEVTSCTLRLSAKEAKVISSCESV